MATTPYRTAVVAPPRGTRRFDVVLWLHAAAAATLVAVGALAAAGEASSLGYAVALPLVVYPATLVLAVWALPRLVYLVWTRQAVRRHGRLTAVWLAFALTFWGGRHLLRREEDRRMRVVVAAVERYHARHDAWPGCLEELVPRDLSRVPCARVVGTRCAYEYYWDKGQTFHLVRDGWWLGDGMAYGFGGQTWTEF